MSSLVNIDQLPLKIQGYVANFAAKILSEHVDNIESVIIYGSATGVNFNFKTSDINIAIIVKSLDVSVLTKTIPIVAQFKNDRISAPLFLTKDYIKSSLDVFPIEFSEMKNHSIVIYGENIFSKITIDPKHIRLFCEEHVKGKLLLIRQSYLESNGDERIVRKILHDSLNGLMPIFRQILIIKGFTPQSHKRDLLLQFSKAMGLNVQHILPIYDDRNHVTLIPVAYMVKHLQDYIEFLQILATHIDSI